MDLGWGGGDLLEFAFGTIALPLAGRGARVAGIDLFGAMVRRLRKMETGPAMEVVIGDMTTTRVAGDFALVALVFNTIDNLTTQDAQLACFDNATSPPGGRFVIETLVPPVQRIPFGGTGRAFASEPAHFGTDVVDIATQACSSHRVWMTEGGYTDQSIPSAMPVRPRWT